MNSNVASARDGTRRSIASNWLPPSLRGYQRSWLVPDIVAGATLAAVAIPASMGYAKIAGMPVVTGLYTLLLPILAFALLGSSRHLAVGADSATAAILFAGLTGMAQPGSPQWVSLASTAALMAGGFLLLASLLRLGFLANFLSRTVLVGFLSGVGVSLILRELPDILRVPPASNAVLPRLAGTIRDLPHAHLPTLLISASVLAIIMISDHFSHRPIQGGNTGNSPAGRPAGLIGTEGNHKQVALPANSTRRIPGSLIAVCLAIAASWIFHLDRYGIDVLGQVHSGLPDLCLPKASAAQFGQVLPMAASMFLVILAQSAATSRTFAQKNNEPLNENRDLVALGVANLLAGFTKTFTVNGSPTQTAVAASAGARSQVAQIVTAIITFAILLCGTSLIARLPTAALASLVFMLGVHLFDVKSLRQIYAFRKQTFAVAAAALVGVVLLGVEMGIFLAIALSIVDHLRQEYHPKDVVLTSSGQFWMASSAAPGVESAPGLLIYRFEAPLFFANADYFAFRVELLTSTAPHPVAWLILDMVAMNDIDYTAGLTLVDTLTHVRKLGINVAIAQAQDVRGQMDALGLTAVIGPAQIFESVAEAVAATEAAPAIH